MGTRSTITFVEKYKDVEYPLVCVYQQFDGYLSCVGKKLCKWLLNKKIVNGLNLNDMGRRNIANGFKCLTAQFIRDFKTNPGNLYIFPIDCDPRDYNYKVLFDCDQHYKDDETRPDKLITIEVDNDGDPPFLIGSPSEVLAYIAKEEEKN